MVSIRWCAKNSKGLELISPNPNLAEAYMKKAENSLKSIEVNFIRDWKISTAYYCIYFSVYSVMMRIGIKCEIHACTIEFFKKFLSEIYNIEDLKLFQKAFKARQESQYYVNNDIDLSEFEEVIGVAPVFFTKTKRILRQMSEKDINIIREKFKEEIRA